MNHPVSNFLELINFEGKFSRTPRLIVAQQLFWSNVKEELYPTIKNWSVGKESSSFVSNTIKMYMIFLTCSVRSSMNWFLNQFLFKWSIINLFWCCLVSDSTGNCNLSQILSTTLSKFQIWLELKFETVAL